MCKSARVNDPLGYSDPKTRDVEGLEKFEKSVAARRVFLDFRISNKFYYAYLKSRNIPRVENPFGISLIK